MKSLPATVLAAAVVLAGAVAAASADEFRVRSGEARGPLTVTNPPFDTVINEGTITNDGLNGVPALTTEGSMTIINEGTISSTVTSSSTSSATSRSTGIRMR